MGDKVMSAWLLDKQGRPLLWSTSVVVEPERFVIHGPPIDDISERYREVHLGLMSRVSARNYFELDKVAKFYVSSMRVESLILHRDESTKFILYMDTAIPDDAIVLKFWPVGRYEEKITVALDQFHLDIVAVPSAYTFCRDKLPLYIMRSEPLAYLTFKWKPTESIALDDYQIFPDMDKTFRESRSWAGACDD